MTQALTIVIVALILAGVGLKGMSWYKRWRVIRRIDPASIKREVRGVSMRIQVKGTRALPGMSTRHANRTTGDLVLTADRFVITTGRGVVADLRESRGMRFSSVRCTGPGRLVIEGEIPGPSHTTGMFRVELIVPDAQHWAKKIVPWVAKGGQFGTFA